MGQLPSTVVETLRDHGNGRGISVCMHVRDYMTTNASMVAELPDDPAAPLRAWVALGQSVRRACTSPCSHRRGVPAALAQPATWARFAALRRRVEADGAALVAVRAELDPLEADLWAEAGTLPPDPAVTSGFVASSWARVDATLARLGV